MLTLALLTAGTLSGTPALGADDGAKWYADYDEAAKVAREEGKDLFVDFTGSDWCGWCKKLDAEVFEHEEFWAKAQEDYVLVKLDFPRSAEAKAKVPNPERNSELKTAHEVRGFPTIVLLTVEGEAYGRIGGFQRGGPENYLELIAVEREERPADGPVQLEVGSTVPKSVKLPDLDGEHHSFGDMRGKIVIVHFWSSTCPYEEHGNPIFKAMEARYADNDDVVMVGINSNKTELGKEPGEDADHSEHYGNLREKMDSAGLDHTMLADHGNRVADMFQAQATPHCFVIDKEGVIQYAGALDDDPRGQKGDKATNYVNEAVAAVMKGETPKTPSTKPYGCSIKRVSKEEARKKGDSDGEKRDADKKKGRGDL